MKLKYITFTAILSVLSLTSCNDFLDKVPDTRVDLNSVEQCRLLMTGAYPTANYALICEFSTDNVVDNTSPDEDGNRYNLSPYKKIDEELFAWEDAKSDTDNDSPSGVWQAYYHSIACANATLEKLAEFEKQGKNFKDYEKIPQLKGEAYMMRAFCHFILANVFCEAYRGPELSKSILGIPYITKPETTVMVIPNRGNLAENYDSIEADLNRGLPLINDGLYSIPTYHFNKTAAYAFATRFYLFKRDYEKVVKYADLAFGGKDVDPKQYMSTIWQNSGDFYYIHDMGRYFASINEKRNFMLMSQYSTLMRRYTGGQRYALNRDAKSSTVNGPGPTWLAYQVKDNKGRSSIMNPCFNGLCGSNGKTDYGTYFGPAVSEQFEYSDKVQGIGYAHNVRSEFTGEETLLSRAEAKLFLGDKAGCLADLSVWELSRHGSPSAISWGDRYIALDENSINRFYLDNDPGFGIVKKINMDEVYPCNYSLSAENVGIMQCIQHFRRIEFVHNGLRWFDIKRLGLEITHVIGKNAQKVTLSPLDPRKALQLPNEVIAAGIEGNNRAQITLVANENASLQPEKYELAK